MLPVLRVSGILLFGLVCLQVAFGAQIIWTGRSVVMTTGHVIVGALTLATTFLITFALHRNQVELAPTP